MKKLILPILISGFLIGCGGSSDSNDDETIVVGSCMDDAQWENVNNSQGTAYYGWVNDLQRCEPEWNSDTNVELTKNEVYEYSFYSNESQESSRITTTTKDEFKRSSYMQFVKPNTGNPVRPVGFYTIRSQITISSISKSFEFVAADEDNYWTGQPLLTIAYPDGTNMRCEGFDGNTMLCENGVEIKNSDVFPLLYPDESGQYTYDYGTRMMNLLGLHF